MKLPSKITSYKQSVFPKMVKVLQLLEVQDYTPTGLYQKMRKYVNDVGEFVEILDCLYMLKRIELDPERKVVRYVKERELRKI